MKLATKIGIGVGIGLGLLSGVGAFALLGILQIATVEAVLTGGVLGSIIGLSTGIIAYSVKDEIEESNRRTKTYDRQEELSNLAREAEIAENKNVVRSIIEEGSKTKGKNVENKKMDKASIERVDNNGKVHNNTKDK